MSIKPTAESDKNNYSQPLEIENENIICKDGFCSISQPENIQKIEKDDTNVFDPV